MTAPELSAQEKERILRGAVSSLSPLRLKVLPSKTAKKLVVLEAVAELFYPGETYTQAEVNARLEEIYPDPVTLRRNLVDFHFLCRTSDGARYWRPEPMRK